MYHIKNHVIPHRVIGAILDVILNILQVEFSKYNWKLSKNSY